MLKNISTRSNIVALTSIMATVFLLFIFHACDNEEETPENNPKPFKTQTYSIPDKTNYIQETSRGLYDQFYFIGWSDDGKVAYIKEPADEATGFYFFNFIVYDTESNEQLFEWKIDTEDEQYEGNLEQTWENNRELFSKTLNKYKIYQSGGGFAAFPLMLNGKNYTIEQDTKYKTHEYFSFDVVSQATISLKQEEETKQIFSKQYPEDLIIDIKTLGIIINPDKSKGLLLIEEKQRGYEGPPHVSRLAISGCQLF
ncbi:MAG: hypothetical protein U9N85_13190 [Bacteroidota bacterium]|nr:hypothetical protein [Bacteroidota bacterium]